MNAPRCENRKPYCPYGGRPMKCMNENEKEFLFVCQGCGQAHIISRPEFKKHMREQIQRPALPEKKVQVGYGS